MRLVSIASLRNTDGSSKGECGVEKEMVSGRSGEVDEALACRRTNAVRLSEVARGRDGAQQPAGTATETTKKNSVDAARCRGSWSSVGVVDRWLSRGRSRNCGALKLASATGANPLFNQPFEDETTAVQMLRLASIVSSVLDYLLCSTYAALVATPPCCLSLQGRLKSQSPTMPHCPHRREQVFHEPGLMKAFEVTWTL